MGESLVERPTAAKKMDESFKSSGGMEVSVSFGRYGNDLLSWEKWSSFSPSKHSDEAGSLSTPGSVAQKKAYFEAHYKNVAPKKPQESEQESSVSPPTPTLDESSNGGYVENSCAEFGLSIGQRSVDADFGSCRGDGDDSVVECERPLVEEAKDESNVNGVELESSDVGFESVSIEVKTPKKESSLTTVKPPSRKNGAKQPNPQSNSRGVAQKVTSSNKGTNSSAIKLLPPSTPKHSRKAPASTPSAASHLIHSMKRETGSSVTRSKRAVSTSLNTSLDLQSSSSMIRKSLMMEKMGDKDIIKRAFKTFQDHIYVSCNDEKPTAPKPVKSAASEAKISTPPPRRKGKEGAKKSVENIHIRSEVHPFEIRLSKSLMMDKRNGISVSSTVSLRSEEQAEKRKEFLQNSEAKSVARAAERARLGAKSKEEKESEIRELRKSLNFKAKPLPSFYKDQNQNLK